MSLYSILIKWSEATGGIGLKLAIDENSSLANTTSRNTTFFNYFGSDFQLS